VLILIDKNGFIIGHYLGEGKANAADLDKKLAEIFK
jgi:hypothetical protein